MKHSPQVLRRSPRSELPRDMHAIVDQYRDVIGFRRLQARLKAHRKSQAKHAQRMKQGRRQRHRDEIKLIRGLVEKRDKMVAALEGGDAGGGMADSLSMKDQ